MLASRALARFWFLLFAVASLLVVPTVAHAYTFGSEVTATGPEQMVFDTSTQPCGPDEHFFQDSNPRALRDSQNRVQLIISHSPYTPGQGHTRRLMTPPGGSLANLPLTVDCKVIHVPDLDGDPSTYDNNEWLVSPYTEDGSTIYGLVHNEFHGWRFDDQCSVDNPNHSFNVKCWYNTITLAKSDPQDPKNQGDPGAWYDHAAPPDHLIASVPYKYVPDTGPEGYFQPSNIIKKGSYYYTLFRAERYQAQQSRSCLMRTNDLSDPSSWRAYDGDANDAQEGFTISFVDPYHETGFVPEQHVCAPISPIGFEGNLVYSNYYGRYMVVYPDVRNVDGESTRGVYYALSNDLIHWDTPKLLMKAPMAWNRTCQDTEDGIRVPAVIDSGSTDRNFNTIGQKADLYYVKSRFETRPDGTCFETLDRDLVRVPVRFQYRPPEPRWATGWFHGCPGAFDTAASVQAQSYFLPNADRNYSGLWFSYKADTTPGGAHAYGIFDKSPQPPGPLCEFNNESRRAPIAFGEGDEVWYSGAFVFPTSGYWDLVGSDGDPANVTIARLSGGAPGWASAITVNKDGLVRLNSNNGSTTTQLLPTLPSIAKDNCWHFFEVYQKLSSDPAQAQNRIRIDGQEYTTATAANFPATTNVGYNKLQAGIVNRFGSTNVSLYADMVGFGYGGPLMHIGCQGVDDNFPQ